MGIPKGVAVLQIPDRVPGVAHSVPLHKETKTIKKVMNSLHPRQEAVQCEVGWGAVLTLHPVCAHIIQHPDITPVHREKRHLSHI